MSSQYNYRGGGGVFSTYLACPDEHRKYKST